jgi:hypothetical protein
VVKLLAQGYKHCGTKLAGRGALETRQYRYPMPVSTTISQEILKILPKSKLILNECNSTSVFIAQISSNLPTVLCPFQPEITSLVYS